MPSKPRFEADFIRHSAAKYDSYGRIARSDNPQAPFDPENQLTPDLTAGGEELAAQEAEKYFAELDPKEVVLFFASSNEARAIETANIFRRVAHAKGFEILKPEHARSDLAEQVGAGEIRVLETLSLNNPNTMAGMVFNPEKVKSPVNVDALDDEARRKWEAGRAIILADDRGSWGANFQAHSDEMQALFPEVKTSQELMDSTFSNLMRLIRFGQKKAEVAGLDKGVKVLGFGHENYMMAALGQYFQEHGMKNCEAIRFTISDDSDKEPEGIKGEYRGRIATIEE